MYFHFLNLYFSEVGFFEKIDPGIEPNTCCAFGEVSTPVRQQFKMLLKLYVSSDDIHWQNFVAAMSGCNQI